MQGVRIWLIVSLPALMTARAGLPSLDGRSVTNVVVDTDRTRLGNVVAAHAAPGKKRFGTDPQAGLLLRAWVAFLGMLPIERLL